MAKIAPYCLPGRTLRVKGFDRFQHYKHRNPPWIKLHAAILDDYEFGHLPDAAKTHLILIWMLASRYQNAIPCDAEWIARRINATEPVDLRLLLATGFLLLDQADSDASKALAPCKQNADTETETETEKTNTSAGADVVPIGVPKQAEPPGFTRFWRAYPTTRKVARAKCLERWKRNRLEPAADAIVAHVEAMKRTEGWRSGFDPAPLRYLGERRWEDGADAHPAAGVAADGRRWD